jgi:hypothetical protein
MTAEGQYGKEQLVVAIAGKDSLVTRRLGWAGRSAMVSRALYYSSRTKSWGCLVVDTSKAHAPTEVRCERERVRR